MMNQHSRLDRLPLGNLETTSCLFLHFDLSRPHVHRTCSSDLIFASLTVDFFDVARLQHDVQVLFRSAWCATNRSMISLGDSNHLFKSFFADWVEIMIIAMCWTPSQKLHVFARTVGPSIHVVDPKCEPGSAVGCSSPVIIQS